MKILYHHRTRGTDAQRVHILEIVNAFRELGHQVEIASLVETEQQNAEREATEASWKGALRGIPFAYEALQLAYNLFGLPWLWWKIVTGKVDFVYERYSLFCFCGVLAARLAGVPIVLEVNSPFALELTLEREIRAARLASWMERIICNASTKVIVVSGPLRRIMLQAGVLESKLALIPNGVNLQHLASSQKAAAIRRLLGIEGKIVIGFVGWFKKWHGLEFLIETFAHLPLKDKAVLMLVGDGPAMASLQEMVRQSDDHDGVVFIGPVAHEQIPDYLNLIDIAVQPAANEYCCPMKIIEYMSVGKAIIAPRQENIQELLPENAAILFEPGNADSLSHAITNAVSDTHLRSQIGNHARKLVHSRGMFWTGNAEKVVRIVSERVMSNSNQLQKKPGGITVLPG